MQGPDAIRTPVLAGILWQLKYRLVTSHGQRLAEAGVGEVLTQGEGLEENSFTLDLTPELAMTVRARTNLEIADRPHQSNRRRRRSRRKLLCAVTAWPRLPRMTTTRPGSYTYTDTFGRTQLIGERESEGKLVAVGA